MPNTELRKATMPWICDAVEIFFWNQAGRQAEEVRSSLDEAMTQRWRGVE